MEQYGIVLENRGEIAAVQIQRHLACANCGKCGILSGSGRRDVTVEALNPIKAESGERVMLESDDRRIIFISFMLYIVPLAGLVAGIVLGLDITSRLGLVEHSELIAVAAGFILMALVFTLIRFWDRRVKDDPKYMPVITGIIEPDSEQ